jgi:hypothetical protein
LRYDAFWFFSEGLHYEDDIMTTEELGGELLAEARREDGENAGSTQLLKKQPDRMEGMEAGGGTACPTRSARS